MIDFQYLYQGICGLARAHKAGTMAGHLGAAVTAGYFIGEDQADLPNAVFTGIEKELERVIAGEEAIWFNAKKVGLEPSELFRPFPPVEEDKHDSSAVAPIAEALSRNVGSTRQSGHNIIFASIAIRALRGHPQYATPQIIEGISRLISGFDKVHAGRGYYGKKTGWKSGNHVKLGNNPAFRPYESVQEMIDVTIQELIDSASTRRQGFGGLWHIINHAAAITEIDRFGYKALAKKALPAHHQHVRLWRSLPDVENELGKVGKAHCDPREPQYWDDMFKRDEARLTHRIKTIYGFHAIKRHVDDKQRQDAEKAFLYLMD